MNATIQSQLDKVESALNTLIDSVAAYNPSVPAANNLLAVDNDLQEGLEALGQHQANHARVLALRESIDQRNAEITSTITALADTRVDLLSTLTSLPLKNTRKVPYTELLDYAKRISRYTSSPTLRLPPSPTQSQLAGGPMGPINGDTQAVKEGKEKGKGIGTESLREDERQWLEPLMQLPFVPWVNDDTMRRGALAQIQAMVERGEDPSGVKPEDSTEEVKEEGEVKKDVVEEPMHDVGGRHVRKEQESKPVVFSGLDLYDPDEDDD